MRVKSGRRSSSTPGAAITWMLSAIGTLIPLFLVDKIIGLRVSPEDENMGLDLSRNGEEGYDLNS